MKINKVTLDELYKKNVLNKDIDSLQIYTLGQVIDKMEYGQIAVQYIEMNEEVKERVVNNKLIVFDCAFYDKDDGCLKGIDLSDGYIAKCNVYKLDETAAKYIILDLHI